MTPTMLLSGHILIVFAGVWFVTEWCAVELSFQVRLGAPWFVAIGTPFYYPWRLFEVVRLRRQCPDVFNRGSRIAASIRLLGRAVAILGSLWRARLVNNYGSSRWVTTAEVEATGLFRAAGVFLGRLDHQYLRHDGLEYVMAFAPTQSGKGIGLVIPTLLSWTASAVIHDIKGENWQLSEPINAALFPSENSGDELLMGSRKRHDP